MELNLRIRKWGNSLAIILPKNIVEDNNLKENEDVFVEVKKKIFVKDVFGIMPFIKKSGQELKDEARKGW